MTQVLVIDDHPVVLMGCRRILEDAGVEAVHECSDFRTGHRMYTRLKPDLLIVDLAVESDRLGGLSFIKNLRVHDTRTPILVFSMHSDPFIVRLALEAGATGYLLKDTAPSELLIAFEKIRRGLPYLCPELAVEVAVTRGRMHTSPLSSVTQREAQTLALLAEGCSYGDIAKELHLSYKTVANTGAQLKAKLGAATLPELIRLGMHYLSASKNAGMK
jgi:two-component system, NarL family, invasion response regulator UvrY